MKTLSRENLQKEFDKKNKEWEAIQKEIEESNIYEESYLIQNVYELYRKSYELIGAMKMLQCLIKEL